MVDIKIIGGTVVGADGAQKLDVLVADGKILAVGSNFQDVETAQTVQADGRLVLPGGIDTHAHLNDPGFTWREDYAHGTAAAVVGGITTVIDMPMQNTPTMSSKEIMDKKLAVIAPQANCDFALLGALIDTNFDKLPELAAAGCVGLKSFIGPVSPDYVSLSYGQIREALCITAGLGIRANFHCEDYSVIKAGESWMQSHGRNDWRAFLDSRPVSAELIATIAVIELARETGAKVHICHVSHPAVCAAIEKAQQEGVDVTAETCTHYLTFTEEDLLAQGALFKCAPPLRRQADREKLWEYVRKGVISSVSSDHSPCRADEKTPADGSVWSTWGGISGIQHVMMGLYSEGVVKRHLDVSVMARQLGELPAKNFGLWGRKGAVQPGFDADIVIWDPEKEWCITEDSLLYLNKISAFVGLRGKGAPEKVFVRGRLAAAEGKLVTPGLGAFVPRAK